MKYRYIKFQIDAIQSGTVILVSEIKFLNDEGTVYSLPSSITVTSNVSNNLGEYPSNLFDGSTSTKWCSSGFVAGTYVLLDLGENNEIDISVYNKWLWYTANDTASYSGRNPKNFKLLGSNDGTNFVLLDSVQNFVAPAKNYTLAYTGTFDIYSKYPFKFRRRLLYNSLSQSNELIWIPLGSNYSTNGVYYKHLIYFDVRTPIYAIARTDLESHDCKWCSWLVFISNPAEGNHDYVTLSECNGYTRGKFFGCEYKTETFVYPKDYNYPSFAISNYDSKYAIVSYWDYSTNTEVKEDTGSLSTIFNPEYIPELSKTLYTYHFDIPKYFCYCQSGIDITRYYILVPKNYVQTTINKWV